MRAYECQEHHPALIEKRCVRATIKTKRDKKIFTDSHFGGASGRKKNEAFEGKLKIAVVHKFKRIDFAVPSLGIHL